MPRRYLARPWDPGMTFEEAAPKALLEYDATWKRISELLQKGFLEFRINSVTKKPRQRMMSKGKPGRIYWITKAGIRVVEQQDYEALIVPHNHRARNTDPGTSHGAIEPDSLLSDSMRILTAYYDEHQERTR